MTNTTTITNTTTTIEDTGAGPVRSIRPRAGRWIAGAAAGLLVAAAASGPVQAEPDGPQRLRGLQDRVFLVEVAPAALPELTVLVNCYTFEADGTWIDPAAPIAFTWEQTSVGASTDYVIRFEDGTVFQTGHVTPARGTGVLQLSAETPLTPFGPLVSSGHEVDACPDGVPYFVPAP